MFDSPWLSGEFFSLVLVPLLIFLARIVDVTIGTLRIIFVSRGMKYLAAFLGFFEVLVWLLAISQVMQNLTNWVTYVAYGLGFATGNFVDILIEERLAMGNLIIRVITRKDATELVRFLWTLGYGVTSVDAMGEGGPVKVIFSIVKRKKLGQIIEVIKRFNPNAFYTIEDVRFVNETFFPAMNRRPLFSLDFLRKRK